jgi:hypothetical protein
VKKSFALARFPKKNHGTQLGKKEINCYRYKLLSLQQRNVKKRKKE